MISSGKDTVAEYLVTQHGFKRASFAGTLKDACASIFGWDREMLEGKTEAARVLRDMVDPWWAKRLDIPHLTPRWVLQHFGTDVCRKYFHNDIWLASLEHALHQLQSTSNVVVSDSRFMNELSMLANAGARTIHVTRGPTPDWWKTAIDAQYLATAAETMHKLGIHRSEWDWVGYKFDLIVVNGGSLEQLYDKVDLIVTGRV